MAKIDSGLLGVTRGKVGSLITSFSKGVNTLKAFDSSHYSRSPKQNTRRVNYQLYSILYSVLLSPLLETYVNPLVDKNTPWNFFVRNNFNSGFSYANLAAMKMSFGKLPRVPITSVTNTIFPTRVTVKWSPNFGPYGSANDYVIGVIINANVFGVEFMAVPTLRSAGVTGYEFNMEFNLNHVALVYIFALRWLDNRPVLMSVTEGNFHRMF